MTSTNEIPRITAPSQSNTVAIWGWVHVGLAALAMVATLPGRTHGLGLFTEPILSTLHLDRESYGFLNLWATLLGGLFCLPCGWLIDRLGTRGMLSGVMIALGVVVIAMSQVQGGDGYALMIPLPAWAGGSGSFAIVFLPILFLFLLLTRGLGQSALSVASLSLIGRSAGRRTGLRQRPECAFVTRGADAAPLANAVISRVERRQSPGGRAGKAGRSPGRGW